MSVEKDILEQVTSDIKITRARYTELIKAEHDADCLKDLILQKAENYQSITLEEVKLLKQLYFVEDKTN
jgi:hypothetical protein